MLFFAQSVGSSFQLLNITVESEKLLKLLNESGEEIRFDVIA